MPVDFLYPTFLCAAYFMPRLLCFLLSNILTPSSIGIDYSWVYLCVTHMLLIKKSKAGYRSDNVYCDFIAHKIGGSLHQQLPSGGQPE